MTTSARTTPGRLRRPWARRRPTAATCGRCCQFARRRGPGRLGPVDRPAAHRLGRRAVRARHPAVRSGHPSAGADGPRAELVGQGAAARHRPGPAPAVAPGAGCPAHPGRDKRPRSRARRERRGVDRVPGEPRVRKRAVQPAHREPVGRDGVGRLLPAPRNRTLGLPRRRHRHRTPVHRRPPAAGLLRHPRPRRRRIQRRGHGHLRHRHATPHRRLRRLGTPQHPRARPHPRHIQRVLGAPRPRRRLGPLRRHLHPRCRRVRHPRCLASPRPEPHRAPNRCPERRLRSSRTEQ